MQISHIEEVDKKRRKVFIDGNEAFTLYSNEIYKYRLEKDTLVSLALYEEIMAVLNKRAKLKVMDYLKQSDKTEKELRVKLRRAHFTDISIDVAIEYVKNFGYLDDVRYTLNYIRLKKGSKSKQVIEFELKNKGIDSAVIKESMDQEYGRDSELTAIKKLIEKKCNDINKLDNEKKTKLIASMCRKGFSYENIRKCMAIMEENNEY